MQSDNNRPSSWTQEELFALSLVGMAMTVGLVALVCHYDPRYATELVVSIREASEYVLVCCAGLFVVAFFADMMGW